MRNIALRTALCAFATAVAAVSPVHAGSGIPDAVERAASFNAASTAGVLVEERHVEINASAGPAHFSEQNDAIALIEDGEYKHVRYLRIVDNGKALSNDRVAQREAQNNDDLDRGKMFFKQPYDARYLHDYTFTETPCSCGAHAQEIAFHSDAADDQHGNGTMVIDPSTGRVITVTYTPNVLPPHASSATRVETFGEAVPGVWTILNIESTYNGHVAFIPGNGTMSERLDHFQRFGNSVAAMQYLRNATL